MDEAALARKLNRHSRSALERAVVQYTPYVGAVLWGVLGGRACREDLEELSADVFLALWAHREEIHPECGLRPWLGTVARNKAKDWLRRHRDTLPLEDTVPDDLERGPEAAAERRDQAARLWAAGDSLEEPDRSLFFRYYYQGEKLKDAARALGLGASAAKQRLLRGRQKLKQQLMEGADAP